MAGLGPSIKPILRDTFIELFEEVVNKLKDKIVDHYDTFDDIPESDEDIIEDYLKTVHKDLSESPPWFGVLDKYAWNVFSQTLQSNDKLL